MTSSTITNLGVYLFKISSENQILKKNNKKYLNSLSQQQNMMPK